MQTIRQWLDACGLPQYADAFERNRVDVDIARDLSDQDLRELGVEALGDRKLLLRAIAELSRPTGTGSSELKTSAPAAPRALRSGTPVSYTPKHLAEKILTTRSAVEGERKVVTVLFVDLVGSTALASGLDPEEMHAIMGRALELMLAEVHRYEGTVNQFLGDGIMALFGAPIAHEDHAKRATYAACSLLKAMEPLNDELQSSGHKRLQIRQGLNTGLVVVGSIGDDLRMDYTAVGDTTNVAARLIAEYWVPRAVPPILLVTPPAAEIERLEVNVRRPGVDAWPPTITPPLTVTGAEIVPLPCRTPPPTSTLLCVIEPS
jgi:class 3 adenylate cyclase